MPIYLVRWPGFSASLIKASDEAHLMDIIDEEGSPRACTWSVYRGPLWVDFVLPVSFKADENHQGPLGLEDIAFDYMNEVAEGWLRTAVPGTDTAQAMETAVLRGAFPHTAAVLDDLEQETPDEAVLRIAVATDVVEHAKATETQATTIADDLTLHPTKTWFFRKLSDGAFVEVPGSAMEAFMRGDRPLQPDAEGVVRVAVAEVTLNNKRPTYASVVAWWKFPVGEKGFVTADYKAAMFTTLDELGRTVPEGVVDANRRFRQRRQRALMWKPAAEDVALAVSAINKKAGYTIIDAGSYPTET